MNIELKRILRLIPGLSESTVDESQRQIFAFLDSEYDAIYYSIESYRRDIVTWYRQTGQLPMGVKPTDIDDPFSLPCCRKAIHSVLEDSLEQFSMQRSGGPLYIRANDANIPWSIHYYFTNTNNPDFIVDPTAGQIALAMGTTLDTWVQTKPELFYRRILIADKTTACNDLGIIYPALNRSFEEIYNLDSTEIFPSGQV